MKRATARRYYTIPTLYYTNTMCVSSANTFNGKKGKKWVLLVLMFSCSLFSVGFCVDFTMLSVPLGFKVNAFEKDKNWVSENRVFAFGFLEIDGENVDEYVVGIMYNLVDKASNLPVWTVGGGLKVPLNSTFMLGLDGRLVLINNLSGITLWSSNSSNLGVAKASLLNNGNLVLLGNKDEVLWESFSSPTNTLLPGQSLHYPQILRAPSTSSISSYYNLMINQLGKLSLVWEHNVTYWRSEFTSISVVKEAMFDSNGVLGLYNNENKVVWSISAKDYGDNSSTLRHLRIDRDGNLRIYLWDNVSYKWKVGWQAVQDQCNVFGSCGLYSVCGYNSSGPVCDCLYSDYLGSSSVGSELDSGNYGCKRMVDLVNCRMHTTMLKIENTVLYGLYPPNDVHILLSEMACKEYCSNDSSCTSATSLNDGSGLCTVKRTSFVSGRMTPYIPSVSFLKVCSVPQAVATQGVNGHGNLEAMSTSSGLSRKKLFGAIALIVLMTILAILVMQILAFWIVYRRRKTKVQTRIPFGKDARMNPHYSVLIRLSFEEIKELTKDFSNQLGTSVYKGVLPNKTPIVAKVLKNVVVSEKEFRVAITTLSGTHHRNLTAVKGFCFEPENKLLVYEYVQNGSLDKWLFDSKEEDNDRIWERRLDIALGVARGLAYLHLECQKCITHGNLKLENVLLDENFVPKLTDFGLESFFTKKECSSSESPSEKDMYMLGQMLLQIVACKREVVGENTEQILHNLNEEHKFVSGDSLEAIERLVRISFWCTQNQPFLRPSIGEVVKVLEGTLSVDRPPSGLTLPRNASTINDTEFVTEIEAEEC